MSRAYVKVFLYWCEYRSRVLSLNLFFNLFNITSSLVMVKWGQWLLSLCYPKKVFHVYVDSWKKFKYRYFLVDPWSFEAHSSLCVMPEDNPSSSCSAGSESNICGDIFQKYWTVDHLLRVPKKYVFPLDALDPAKKEVESWLSCFLGESGLWRWYIDMGLVVKARRYIWLWVSDLRGS